MAAAGGSWKNGRFAPAPESRAGIRNRIKSLEFRRSRAVSDLAISEERAPSLMQAYRNSPIMSSSEINEQIGDLRNSLTRKRSELNVIESQLAALRQ